MSTSTRAEPRRWDYRPWLRRAVKLVVALVIVVVLAYIAAAFLPRWWSHRIGDQVGGRITLGVVLGLFYGFVFTFLPLLVLRWGFDKRRPLARWAWFVLGALVLAIPNLLTLGIVIGTGNAAHAGERTLDVDAPGFRGASLAGAIVAVLVVAAGQYLVSSRHHTRKKLDDLRRRSRERPAD